jgi:hypothetical protein
MEAREEVGGEEKELEKERVETKISSHFPFFSLSSLGIQSKSTSSFRDQAALETMPSDNEEQAVDAKTIAELTEQV